MTTKQEFYIQMVVGYLVYLAFLFGALYYLKHI